MLKESQGYLTGGVGHWLGGCCYEITDAIGGHPQVLGSKVCLALGGFVTGVPQQVLDFVQAGAVVNGQ